MGEPGERAGWQNAGITEPATAAYAPYSRGRCWLVTCHTRGRLPVFQSQAAAHLWQTELVAVRRSYPYLLQGYVTLPDHVHLLLQTPAGKPVEQVLQRTTLSFERNYRIMMGVPESEPVWPQQQQIKPIDDLDAFAAALDYLHYNPVHHGLVERPETWPESSYAAWIERKLYKLGWGWTKPRRLNQQNWE
jgi:putative transposase